MVKWIFIFIFILFIFSCKKNTNEPDFNTQNDVNILWKGKEIIFFQSIKKMIPLKEKIRKTEFTIVAYYDGNCSICFFELSKWLREMESFDKYDISFQFILGGQNRTSIEINLETINFPVEIVYLDEKNEFGNNYNFLLDVGYVNSSILLDKNNKVLSIGNPTISQKIRNNYKKLMSTSK